MSDLERAIADEEIEEKINKFADDLEAQYLAEYNERIANGETGIEKTSVSNILYYETFVLKMVNNMEMSMSNIYIVTEENNGEYSFKIYKEDTNNLIATVNENGDVVFTSEGMNKGVSNKNLQEILDDNEKNETAELKQENVYMIEEELSTGELDKEAIKNTDIKQLEQESNSKEELEAKLKLQIRPGTVQSLENSEINEFDEFRGHNVEFGYSRVYKAYIAYDKDSGDVLMGPAVENSRTITKQSADGELTTERHSAMMQSRSNPDKMITIQIGQYGERILNEADRTTEGDFVARTIDIHGKGNDTNKELKEALNVKENRENLGETADDLNRLGVTQKGTKKYFSEAEFEEFMEEIQKIMGPCSRDELEDRFQKAEGETLQERLEDALATYRREQIEYNDRIRNGEGRGLGEESEDPRRAI